MHKLAEDGINAYNNYRPTIRRRAMKGQKYFEAMSISIMGVMLLILLIVFAIAAEFTFSEFMIAFAVCIVAYPCALVAWGFVERLGGAYLVPDSLFKFTETWIKARRLAITSGMPVAIVISKEFTFMRFMVVVPCDAIGNPIVNRTGHWADWKWEIFEVLWP